MIARETKNKAWPRICRDPRSVGMRIGRGRIDGAEGATDPGRPLRAVRATFRSGTA